MARVCHFYGMSYFEVMDMPLRTFWSFNKQVRRLRAENNLSMIDLFLLAQMGVEEKHVAQVRKALLEQMEEPTKAKQTAYVDPAQHKRGLAQLRALQTQLTPQHGNPQPQS